MKFTKPFKDCTLANLTQGFSKEHQAVDFAGKFGEVLVAPFNCKIVKISQPENLRVYREKWELGCGVLMQSIEWPEVRISYWHTQPIFPVREGDLVVEGQPVALMGNTGFVMAGEKFVPLSERLSPPYHGTHLHLSCGVGGENVDARHFIDWNRNINFNLLTLLRLYLLKIQAFLLVDQPQKI